MADQDQNLNVKVTAEDQASPTFNAATAAVTSFDAMLKAAGASASSAMGAIVAGADKALDALLNLGASGKNIGPQIAAGAAQATGALDAMVPAVDGVKDALAGLLGPVAALFAIGSAIEESVKAASSSEAALTQIGVLVKNAGGNAQQATKTIDDFATHLAQSSIFGKDAFVQGIQAMLVAGISLDTAMKSQQAAMDLSAAKNIDLADAEHILIQAHNGRERALESLGIVTKQEVADGLSYDQVLARIEQRTGGSAAAALNTMSGALKNLGNNTDVLFETIGNDLEPVVVSLAHSISNVEQAVVPLVDAFGEFEQSISGEVTAAISDASAALATFGPELQSVGQSAQQAFAAVVSAAEDFYSRFKPEIDEVVTLLEDFGKNELSALLLEFRAMFDEVTAAADAFTALFTGNWTKLHDDVILVVDDMLQYLEAQTGGKLAAVVAFFESAVDTIKAYFAGLGEAMVGYVELLIGPIQNWENVFNFVAQAIAGTLNDLGTFFQSFVADFISIWDATVNQFIDFANGIIGAVNDVASALGYAGNAIGTFAEKYHPIAEIAQGTGDALNAGAVGAASYSQHLADATKALEQFGVQAENIRKSRLPGTGGDKKPESVQLPKGDTGDEIAGSGKASEGDPYTPVVDTMDADKINAVVAAQDTLTASLKNLTDSEKPYASAVELATTEQQKYNDEIALKAKISADAVQAGLLLTAQVNSESSEIAKLTTQHAQQKTALEAAIATANAYSQSLDGQTKLTAAEKDQLRSNQAAVDELKKSYGDTGTTLDKLKSQRQENINAEADEKEKTQELAAAYAAQVLAYNEATAASIAKVNDEKNTYDKSTQQQIDYFQKELANLDVFSGTYYAKRAELEDKIRQLEQTAAEDRLKADDGKQQLADEEATYKLSIAQQIAYYQQRLAIEMTADGASESEIKRYQDEIQKLELQDYEQRVDQHDTYVKTIQQTETTLLNDLLDKHKSFKDDLKKVYDDVLKNYEAWIIQMLEKSSLLSGLENVFTKIFGGGGSGLPGAGGSGGASGASSASGGGIQSLVGALIPGLTGQQSGVAPSSITAAANAAGSASTASAAEGINPSTDPQLYGISQGTVTTTAGVGGALAGIGLGSIGATLTGGNAADGSIGGALLGGAGGVVGTILGGPVGGAIGSAAGGLIGGVLGGLFGPHVNAYNNPDIDDTQQYGQGLANATGKQAGANGQTFQASSTVLATTGGIGEIAFAEELLAQGQTAFEKATGDTAAQYQQALATIGASATGSGTIKFGKNIGDQTIVGATTGGGEQIRYNDLDNELNQILTGYTNSGGTPGGIAPTFSLNRLYPDANVTTLTNAQGQLINTSTGLPTVGATTGASVGGTTVAQNGITITGNTFIGTGSVHDLADMISKAQYDNSIGIGKSGASVGIMKRFTGDATI